MDIYIMNVILFLEWYSDTLYGNYVSQFYKGEVLALEKSSKR